MFQEKVDFELFKSEICHRVKREGDIDFIINVLKNEEIAEYFERKWHLECLYLLAMVDYLCRENNMPLIPLFDELRQGKFREIIYPAGVLLYCGITKDENYKEECLRYAIPEFLRHNIVEAEIRNVC